MFLRCVAAASFFLPVLQATRSRGLAAGACILFATANAGIESTAWQIVNMFVYPGIAFANLSIYFILKSRVSGRSLHHLVAVAFAYLAIFVSPNRLYSLAMLGTLDLLWLARKEVGISRLMMREAILYLPMLYFLYRVSPAYATPQVILGSRVDIGSVMAWFTSYGYLALPFDIVNSLLGGIYDAEGSRAVISIFLGAVAILVAVVSLAILSARGVATAYILAAWSLIGILLATSDLKHISHVDLFAWLLGGVLFVVFIRAFISWRRQGELADLMLFSTLWAFGSIVLSWLTMGTRTPDVAFVTDHRYLAVPNAGFTLAVASLLGLLSSRPGKRTRIIVFLVLAALIAMNLVADQLYFERIRANRHLSSWEHVFFRK